jgi:hypothetical protein
MFSYKFLSNDIDLLCKYICIVVDDELRIVQKGCKYELPTEDAVCIILCL